MAISSPLQIPVTVEAVSVDGLWGTALPPIGSGTPGTVATPVPSRIVYRRGHLVERADAAPDAPLRFVVATEGVKADGLNLLMSGVRLDRYRANPVVLWAHSYREPPLGRALDIWVDGPRLLADVEFDSADETAARVESKYRRGFMRAVSVGFDPITVEKDGKSVSWWEGGDVTEWEMYEFSAVPVPMDSDALLQSGFLAAARALRADLGRLLDGIAPPSSEPEAQEAVPVPAKPLPARDGTVLSERSHERVARAFELLGDVLAERAAGETPEMAALRSLRDLLPQPPERRPQ